MVEGVSAPVEAPQFLTALRKANTVRLGASEVKRAIASGEMGIDEAVFDPRATCLTTYALLCSQRRWGRHKTTRVLAKLGIRETRRVGDLTARQRGLIADLCFGD